MHVKCLSQQSYICITYIISYIKQSLIKYYIVGQVASKIRCEIADVSSEAHDSIVANIKKALT